VRDLTYAWANPSRASTTTDPITDVDHWEEWFTGRGVGHDNVPLVALYQLVDRFRSEFGFPSQVQSRHSAMSTPISTLDGTDSVGRHIVVPAPFVPPDAESLESETMGDASPDEIHQVGIVMPSEVTSLDVYSDRSQYSEPARSTSVVITGPSNSGEGFGVVPDIEEEEGFGVQPAIAEEEGFGGEPELEVREQEDANVPT
jgi:hypothetical protein